MASFSVHGQASCRFVLFTTVAAAILLLMMVQHSDSQRQTKCSSQHDCSYNGDCISGYCRCYPQWTNAHCAELNLLPTQKSAGYQTSLDGQLVSSWGGSVLYDNATGIYHMYASEISEFCGINVWNAQSILVHAQSKPGQPMGVYTREEEIDDIFSHEPNAIQVPVHAGNPYTVVYYSNHYPPPAGNANIDPCTRCANGVTLECAAQQKPNDPYVIDTVMIYSNSFDRATGDRVWSEKQVLPSDTGIDANLAGVIRPNGSYVGIFRGLDSDTGWNLLTSEDWMRGELYTVAKIGIDLPDGFGAEDPYLYWDANGQVIHSVWHGGGWDSPWGYHWFSEDGGYSWTGYSESVHTYNATVAYTDGSTTTFQRCERPHLIMGADGHTPIALTNGVELGTAGADNPFFPDYTFTLLRPINQQ